MQIRRVTESDLAELGELYLASWRAGYKGLLPQKFLDELTAERWTEKLLGRASFAVTEGEKIVGHCLAHPSNEPKMRGWGEIHTMYVHPNFWRTGYGTAVFRYAENWLFEQGFDDVYLYVLEGNERAERFYKAQGFQPNSDTLCCEIGGTIVTDNRYVKRYPRTVRYGADEEKTVASGAAAIEKVLRDGDFKARSSLLLCLDGYFDPYYGKTIPEREKVIEVLRGYEKTAADSTLFDVRELLEYC